MHRRFERARRRANRFEGWRFGRTRRRVGLGEAVVRLVVERDVDPRLDVEFEEGLEGHRVGEGRRHGG
jgi:hypothetical protein